MPDKVLPWPEPGVFDNPQPYTGPTSEETQAFARLQQTADGIREWVRAAYMSGTQPEDWTALGDALREVAEVCLALGAVPADQTTVGPAATDQAGTAPEP